MLSIRKMLENNEKIFLIILVISSIILIFMALYFTNSCPNCDETYSKNKPKSIIVYQIEKHNS